MIALWVNTTVPYYHPISSVYQKVTHYFFYPIGVVLTFYSALTISKVPVFIKLNHSIFKRLFLFFLLVIAMLYVLVVLKYLFAPTYEVEMIIIWYDLYAFRLQGIIALFTYALCLNQST